MNTQSTLRKIYNNIKNLQIPDEEVVPENMTRAVYMAGMLDSAKIFIKVYNGELSEEGVELEMNRFKEIVN